MKNILLAIDSLMIEVEKKDLTYEELRALDEKLSDIHAIIHEKEIEFSQYWEDC